MALFAFETLECLPDSLRETRLLELTEYLRDRISHASGFDLEVRRLVDALRTQGHDIWSWDESDDFQIWGPDYMKLILHGLLIDFRMPDQVQVMWLDQADPTTVREVFGRGLS